MNSTTILIILLSISLVATQGIKDNSDSYHERKAKAYQKQQEHEIKKKQRKNEDM